MATFVDPFTDTGFKIIFGKENSSNDILKEFLNDLFADQPDFEPIESLTYLNNERSRERIDDRTVIYDIMCTTHAGHRFIVEMQRQPQPHFFGRAVYYVSRAVYEQGLKTGLAENNDWNYDVIPVVGVFFCNFYVRELGQRLVHHVRLCDTDDNKPVSNLMRYAFIQLPVFKKRQEDCVTEFDKWIYTLKNMSTMQTMPFSSHRDVFDRLARVGNVAALSAEERQQYEYDVKKARDYRAEMQFAIDKGVAKGRAEGRAEGRAAEKYNIAVALKSKGVNVILISETTGLSVGEIEKM